MKEIDSFAADLFEEAKRFLEKAKETTDPNGRRAYLHAALLLGMSSLEAHLFAVSDEMASRSNLSILDQSILLERDYSFEKGVFKLTKNLKMYKLLDRLEFIAHRFALPGKGLDKNASWWSKLIKGLEARNALVHPKEGHTIDYEQVKDAFEGILGALDAIYLTIYDQHFPALGRKFDSRMEF